jgi:hypothetical protein
MEQQMRYVNRTRYAPLGYPGDLLPLRTHLTTLIAVALLLLSAAVAHAAPANDDIASATVIPGLPFADDPLDTTEATTAPDDPDCVGNGPTVWYAFTPAADVSVLVNTFGSDYDTTLSAYTDSPSSLTQIAALIQLG